jgi:putative endonuclease
LFGGAIECWPPLNVIPAKAGTHASFHKGELSWGQKVSGGVHMKSPCVYILASKPNGVLYIGVTSNLEGRLTEHDQGLIEGFTKRHGVKWLVYYEFHDTMDEAIRREKRLKEWRRAWKVRLIESMNPEWRNLFDPATGEIAAGPADGTREKR